MIEGGCESGLKSGRQKEFEQWNHDGGWGWAGPVPAQRRTKTRSVPLLPLLQGRQPGFPQTELCESQLA